MCSFLPHGWARPAKNTTKTYSITYSCFQSFSNFTSFVCNVDFFCCCCFFKDACGTRNGTFSIRVESVPCCDEALTCSRSVIFDLQVNVSFRDTQIHLEITNLIFGISPLMYMRFAKPSLFQPKGIVTLTLSDMKVTRRHHNSWTLERDFLYSVRSVGLYIIILVPSKGITLIWDKHTWVAVELQPHWRVSSEHY